MTGRPARPPAPPARRSRVWRAVLVLALLAVPGGLLADQALDRRRLARAAAAEAAGDLPAAGAALAPLLGSAPADPEVRFLAARVGWRTRLGEPFPAGWERPVRGHLAAALAAPWLAGRVSGDEDALAALAGDRAAERRLDRRAAAGGPDAPAYLEALARCHLDAHRLGATAEAAGRLLAARPGHALAHYWRALAADLAGGRSPGIESDLRRAAELDPGRPAYRLHLALHLVGRRAELPEARGLLEQLRRELPDDPDVLRGLGAALLLTDPQAARPVLARLTELRPDDGEALAQLGQAELEVGELAAAERHLRAAVARADRSYTAQYQLHRLLTATGRAAEGGPFRAAAEAIAKDQERMTALAGEATARPADPAPRAELGRLHLRAGSVPLGVYWLETALEVDPGYEPARQALAEHRQRAGGGRR